MSLDLLNKKVQAVNVTNSNSQDLVFAKIINYDQVNKYLTVEDINGNPYIFKMTDQTAILMYGVNYNLANFTSNFSQGKRVNIQLSKQTVTSISLATQLTGVITDINATTKQITVKSGSQNVSFTMAFAPSIELYGKPSATLSDLNIGDSVTLDLNPGQQDTILKITATSTKQYKVLLAYSTSRQITLQDAAGNNLVITLDTSVPIVAEGKVSPTFSDILADDYLKLSFKGNTITNAEIVSPVRGKVLAVDAGAGTLTVQDFAGLTKLVTIGANATVTGNGNAQTTLAAVQVGDRVQVVKNGDGNMNVKVATALQRTFVAYNGGTNTLSFTSTAGSDSYIMSPRVYLHKGTDSLAITGFAANDAVTVYLIDGRVIEMEK
ncbi:hypothetical protein [Gordoniibacillus kamchatkensis]|uniref:hypothetical protein n=1 Tax=Gordoniibacillus kamchatkensis TaxID=1590651 RepID=UPI00069716AB|nr:hypothetical protein [Paenibacillus sp. VKM B-2647]